MKLDANLFADNPLNVTLDSPLEAHLEWAMTHIFLKDYQLQKNTFNGIQRPVHGAQHAARVAVYISIVANLYRKYGNEEALSLTPRSLKMLQIAAIFHDSGREADGPDKWEWDSAFNLYYYLTITLKVPLEDAREMWEAIVNKDFQIPGNYVLLEPEEKVIKVWEGKYDNCKKTIYSKLIGSSDCLDIIRARFIFEADYLDFYKDNPQGPALDDLATVITEIRSLIETQGDSKRKLNPDLKKKYEHQPGRLLQLIVDDIKMGCIEGTNTVLRPALAALYNEGKLMPPTQLNALEVTPKPDAQVDPVIRSLRKGTLFARSIRSPAAILFKTEAKSAKIGINDSRYRETLTQCELRKITRKPQTPTVAGKLGKLGNRNRSCTLLGWGASTYSAAGLLCHNDSITNINRIEETVNFTGYGKRASIETRDLQEIQAQFDKLQYSLKKGGSGKLCGTYMATHNEVALDLIQAMLCGVFYTNDANIMNIRVCGTEEGLPLHPNAPILEAIFIQKEYLIQTGIVLPIYEYSGVHNFIQKREFDSAKIISLWSGLIEHYIARYDEMEVVDTDNHAIETMKILAVYEASSLYKDEHRSLDSNYDVDLKNRVNETIKDLIKKYELFLAVSSDKKERVETVLASLEHLSRADATAFLNQTHANGKTALAFVKSAMMMELIGSKIVATSVDKYLLTKRLMYFVVSGTVEDVRAVLKLGCDYNLKNKSGNTALIVAAQMGKVEVVQLLYEAGADFSIQGESGLTALSWATKRERRAVIIKILSFLPVPVGAINADGSSPIMHASNFGLLELFKNKLKPNADDQKWLNSIMFKFAKRNNAGFTKAIIDLGADIHARDEDGQTLAEIIGDRNDSNFIELLRQCKRVKVESAPGTFGLFGGAKIDEVTDAPSEYALKK